MTDEPSQDVLTTVRKRIELVINEIADAELIAMLRTAMRELDLAIAQSDAGPQETGNKQSPEPDSILHELGNCPTQSDAEPTVKMDWSLSEESRRQLEEIERATVRPGDARLNNVVGLRPDGQPDAEPVTLTDVEMDALLKVRATIEQTKEKPMQYEDQLVIGNVFNTAIQQILAEFEGNADPNLVAALAQGILVRLDQAGYVIVKK